MTHDININIKYGLIDVPIYRMMIKKITNYKGKIYFNKKYPDGVKRRQLDSTKIKKLGWRPKIKLKNGLQDYCHYYLNEILPNEKN